MDLDLFSSFEAQKNQDERDLQKVGTKRSRVEDSTAPDIPTLKVTATVEEVKSTSSNTGAVATVTVENPQAPAKEYKFQLDSFQREAIASIERNESVLVAAHTSAGKTAVAEYAIAKSLRDKQKVIYTSPIKALSNQKFRDLQEEFTDVGLMTGDMTVNPNAACLIMTTEILRSMLYRGSEVVREVAWLIYDEVHYMRDKERGVVWEESIIMMPHNVRFVFLSATIPNAHAFVSWVSKIHHQPCNVVYTDYRPVPLQHFVFPAGADGLYLVVDEKGKFREDNFQQAMSILQPPDPASGKEGRRREKKTSNPANDLFRIVKLIMEKALDPCIVFAFSKKNCETYAMQMAQVDFNTPEEKALVTQVYNSAVSALSEDDQVLPHVLTLLPLLKKGVGIHHGGLLPILKEVIEILFQEGLIKCLFATETFSIGINMPAKTVVFSQTKKFDGQDFRWITSGEYIQMSGRAGRRGKDDRGIVIQMLDAKTEPDVVKGMIYGPSDPLFSSYHINYNMVLNMLRVEGADPENLIKCSFHQFQQEQEAPQLMQQAKELEREAARIEIADEEQVAEFYSWSKLLAELKLSLKAVVVQPQYCLPFLQSGRLVHLPGDWGWGAVVRFRELKGVPLFKVIGSYAKEKFIGDSRTVHTRDSAYVVEMLMEVQMVDNDSGKDPEGVWPSDLKIRPVKEGGKGEMSFVFADLREITEISAVRLTMPSELAKKTSKEKVQKAVREVRRRFEKSSGVPLLDPVRDMGIPSDVVKPLEDKIKGLEGRVQSHGLMMMSTKADTLTQYEVKVKLQEDAESKRTNALESQSVTMKDELHKMKRVLKKLEFIDNDDVLCLKGRFACEVSTGHELVLTNMVFDGIFNELNPDQIVGLLSCFVHTEGKQQSGGDSASKLRSNMQAPVRQLQAVARHVAEVCKEANLAVEEEEFVGTFSPALVDVCYAWSGGAKFADVSRMTDSFEGSIIRALRRLDELLRQLGAASQAIGNLELMEKFTEGAQRIRRGVVFAASLYI